MRDDYEMELVFAIFQEANDEEDGDGERTLEKITRALRAWRRPATTPETTHVLPTIGQRSIWRSIRWFLCDIP